MRQSVENMPNVTPNICLLNAEFFYFLFILFICLKLDNHLEQQCRFKCQRNLPQRSRPFPSLSDYSLESRSQPHCAVHVNYTLCVCHRCSQARAIQFLSFSPTSTGGLYSSVGVGAGLENGPRLSFSSHPHVGGKLSELLCTLIVAPSPNRKSPL